MVGLEKRLTVIAENLANVSSPGFKRELEVVQAFGNKQSRRANETGMSPKHTDFTQGELRRTGEQNDLALYGDGFFVIEGPQGELLTRNGTFSVNENGVLINSEGFPVAWTERPGSITPVAENPLNVNSQGEVFQGSEQLGKLRIVDFEDKQLLAPSPEGYLVAPFGIKEIPSTAVVHQGALEASNAIGIKEIIGMIEVQRSFEQMGSLVSSINDSYSRLTRSI